MLWEANILIEKSKKQRIYVHFYNFCNFGDDAFVAMLAHRYPEIKFYISGKKNLLGAFDKMKNVIPYYDFKIINIINKIFIRIVKKDVLYKCRARKCDCCLTIGGSIFIEPQRKELEKYFDKKRKKFYPQKNNCILGANFGPYKSKEFLDFFRQEFKKYNLISFRDLDSFTLFSDIDNVIYAPDILFGIESILDHKKKLVYSKSYIVISVIDKVSNINKYIHKLKEIIKFYQKKEYDVVLLSLCNAQNDDLICEKIVDDFENGVNSLSYSGSNMQEIMQCIKCASYVIGARFHSIIMALAFRIPCFPIVYSNKTKNMLNDIKYSGNFCFINQLENCSLEKIDENRFNQYIPDIEDFIEESKKHFSALDQIVFNRINE